MSTGFWDLITGQSKPDAPAPAPTPKPKETPTTVEKSDEIMLNDLFKGKR